MQTQFPFICDGTTPDRINVLFYLISFHSRDTVKNLKQKIWRENKDNEELRLAGGTIEFSCRYIVYFPVVKVLFKRTKLVIFYNLFTVNNSQERPEIQQCLSHYFLTSLFSLCHKAICSYRRRTSLKHSHKHIYSFSKNAWHYSCRSKLIKQE